MLLFVEPLWAQRQPWCTSCSSTSSRLLHMCIWRQTLPQLWGNKIKLFPKPVMCGKNSKHSVCQFPQTMMVQTRSERTTETQLLHPHAAFSRATTVQPQLHHILFNFVRARKKTTKHYTYDPDHMCNKTLNLHLCFMYLPWKIFGVLLLITVFLNIF